MFFDDKKKSRKMTIKEYPILFSTPMIQAILEERKTQTRRIVKSPKVINDFPDLLKSAYKDGDGNWIFWSSNFPFDDTEDFTKKAYPTGSNQGIKCPYGRAGNQPTAFRVASPPSPGFYWVRWEPNDAEESLVWLERVLDEPQDDVVDHDVERWVWGKDQSDDRESICSDIANPLDITWRKPGDRLWVRETWYQSPHGIIYKADWDRGWGDDDTKIVPLDNDSCKVYHVDKWKPSIHMPREACRILLEITGIRVERLQDISEEDAIAEGIEFIQTGEFAQGYWQYQGWKDYINVNGMDNFFDFPTESFKSLWDSINAKKRPWTSNPWVWVIEFKCLDMKHK